MTISSKRAWAAAAGLLAMCLTACCPAPALKPVVAVPELPALPTIQATEFVPVRPNDPESPLVIEPSVYTRLVTRDILTRETLEQCQEMLRELTD